jgi:hypothetical protein
MSFRIRPGKVACAGLVGIMMVLPNSIWKGPDAKIQPKRIVKIEKKVTPEAGRLRTRLHNHKK